MPPKSGTYPSIQKNKKLFFILPCILIFLTACNTLLRGNSENGINIGVVGICNVPQSLSIEIKPAKNIILEYPVTEGIPIPIIQKPITVENASKVIQLARWGTGAFKNVLWSPNQKIIAIASTHGVYIYDTTTYSFIQFLSHSSTVDSVYFTADSQKLITYSQDDVMRFWAIKNGTLISQFSNAALSGDITFSPRNDLFATSESENVVRIWDINSLKIVMELQTPKGARAMAFSPNGSLLAIADDFEVVHIWQLKDGKVIHEFNKGDWALVDSVAFSPDGEMLATGSYGGNIQIWNINDGKRLKQFNGSIFPIRSLGFSSDGKQLFSSDGGAVKVWSMDSGWLINSFDEYATSYAISPDNKLLATIERDVLHIWRITDNTLLAKSTGTTLLQDVAVTHDKKLIVVGDTNGFIEYRRMVDGAIICRIKAHRADTRGISLSYDDSSVVSVGYDGDVRAWSMKDGSPIFTLPNANTRYTATFSPDGKYLATVSQGNFLEIWNANNQSPIYQLLADDSNKIDWIASSAFSPDGTLVAAGAIKKIYIWKLGTGQRFNDFPANNNISTLAFSPDGKFIVADSTRGISLWNVSTKQSVYTTNKHSNVVETVAFSPDGQIIASGSADGTIRLWQANDGKEIGILRGHSHVRKVVFTEDGILLVSVGEDGSIGLWGIP